MTKSAAFSVDINGFLLPWHNGDDCAVTVAPKNNDADLFITIFSEHSKLDRFFRAAQISYDSVKAVERSDIFLKEMPRELDGRRVRVVIDPEIGKDGATGFQELIFN